MSRNNILLRFAFAMIMMACTTSLFAQEKKSLSPSDMPGWSSMSSAQISNDGMWVSYRSVPYVGDATLYIKNPSQGIEKSFDRGYRAQFSPGSSYMVFMIKPELDSLRKLKLDKVPRSKWPKDTLAVYVFEKDTLMKFPGVKSFKMASEGSDWMTFQYRKPQKKKRMAPPSKKKKKKKSKTPAQPKVKPIKRKTSDLVMYNPITGEKTQIPNVIAYNISEYGNSIGYIRSFGDTIDSVGVYWFNNGTGVTDTAYLGLGNAKKPVFNEMGDEMVWILSQDTGEAKAFSLYSTRGNKGTRIIVDTNNRDLPKGHTVSENGRIYFSEDGTRIFFGTAERPVEEPKDSIPNDEKAKLDVWSWTDVRVQPMQLLQKKRDEMRTNLAVFNISSQKVVQLADDSTDYVYPLMSGNSGYAMYVESMMYGLSTSWDFPFKQNIYRQDLTTGEKVLVGEGVGYNRDFSPSGKYFLHYDGEKGIWYSTNIDSNKTVEISGFLTKNGQILANMESEIPAKPFAYGVVGWSDNEEWVLIQSKYDIWAVDPNGQKEPRALTNGKADENHWKIGFKNFDRDREYIRLDSIMMISAKNLDTNAEGVFVLYPNAERITEIMWGDEMIAQFTKARDENRFFCRPMSFVRYPDMLYFANLQNKEMAQAFDQGQVVSDIVPQQKEYKWGMVKKYTWTDEKGVEQKGLLYYPEQFDAEKEYPLMIYFYEKNFGTEHYYKSFAPSRSVISIPLYTSNGYLVFVPDIHYGTGHPGTDAVNTVVSGAESLAAQSFVDRKRMAIQGQSWGGYQVAYIVTQTDIFAAAMAGAPVSNMTSAYGGIRWGSGMSREFQYEKTQSRIGADLWSAQDLYIENSPLFFLPKVTTPLLIMHNDNDGAVPYYQGIELFMGMRRLQKPAWLLVYNREQHNLTMMPNRLDLSLRMFQFFNHYLKGEPMPMWMKEGVPAIDKGKDYGFKLEE